jgi:hypothetical protein
MERLQWKLPQVLSAQLLSGSTATNPNPDSATVEVFRSDGTVLAASGPATDDGVGRFVKPLTVAQTSLLDVLRADWSMSVDGGPPGTITTYTELVSGFLCTLGDLGNVYPGKSDEDLAVIRSGTERRLESACRQALIPRFTVETKTIRRRVRLAWPHIRAIRFVIVNDVALSPGEVANLSVSAVGTVYGLPRFNTVGIGRCVIGYEHGLDYPPGDTVEMMKMAALETFPTTDSETIDSRVIRREADNQSVTYANPSSSASFLNPTLRQMVKANAAPLVA